MTLKPETKMAIQAMVLGNYSQESGAQFVSSISFVFRELKKLEKSMQRSYQTAVRKVLKVNPELKSDEVYDRILRQKSFMILFFKNENKRARYYQFMALQISNWMKSSYKMHAKTLAKYSGKPAHKWAEKFQEIGPRHQKLPWAQSIIVASNYVRHKEEWHFNSIEIDDTGKLRTKKNIINTLEGDLPKKNAKYLLNLGVTENILFGSIKDATGEILELCTSAESSDLKANCDAWLKAVNTYVKKELFKLI